MAVKRFLLDTNHAQLFAVRDQKVVDRFRLEQRKGAKLGICSPGLGELWSGVELSQSKARNEQYLRGALSEWIVWPYLREHGQLFGQIRADLQKRGITIQQIDIQTAAIAFKLGNCTVVTTDSDFSYIPGLAVENWLV